MSKAKDSTDIRAFRKGDSLSGWMKVFCTHLDSLQVEETRVWRLKYESNQRSVQGKKDDDGNPLIPIRPYKFPFNWREFLVSDPECPDDHVTDDQKEYFQEEHYRRTTLFNKMWAIYLPVQFTDLLPGEGYSNYKVHEIVAKLRHEYGNETGESYSDTVSNLITTISKEFSNASNWMRDIEVASNAMNNLSQELFQRPSTVEDITTCLTLRSIPTTTWANKIKMTKKSFTFENVKELVKNVYPGKSFKEIHGNKNDQSIPVNYTLTGIHGSNPKNKGKGKMVKGTIVKGKQPKGKADPTQCWYCLDRYLVQGKKHQKVGCPKYLDDQSKDIQRKSIFHDPITKTRQDQEVKVSHIGNMYVEPSGSSDNGESTPPLLN
jgi:hypothetical protein